MQQHHMKRAEHASTSEVRCWLDEAKQEGRADTAGKVGPIAAALQRLSEEVREERAQAAEVAGDYTSHQLQALPCPALPCPALPCSALPCPALPCPALPCLALPCLPCLPCPACPGHAGVHTHAHVFVAVGMLHHHESCTNIVTDEAHMPSQVRQIHHHGRQAGNPSHVLHTHS